MILAPGCVCRPPGVLSVFLPLFAGSDGVRVVSYMRCTLYQGSTKVIVFSFVVGSLFKKTYIFGVNGRICRQSFAGFHDIWGIICPAVLHHTHRPESSAELLYEKPSSPAGLWQEGAGDVLKGGGIFNVSLSGKPGERVDYGTCFVDHIPDQFCAIRRDDGESGFATAEHRPLRAVHLACE